jgi:EpsI family protein
LGSYSLSETGFSERYEDPKAEAALYRFYQSPTRKQVELFVGYRSYQEGSNRLQSPKLNLPLGWNFVWVKPDRIPIPGSPPIDASWMLTRKGESQRLVLYWYQARGRTFGDELSHRMDQMASVFSSGRTDGAVVRIAAPVEPDETPAEAREFIKAFVSFFYPHLVRVLPG